MTDPQGGDIDSLNIFSISFITKDIRATGLKSFKIIVGLALRNRDNGFQIAGIFYISFSLSLKCSVEVLSILPQICLMVANEDYLCHCWHGHVRIGNHVTNGYTSHPEHSSIPGTALKNPAGYSWFAAKEEEIMETSLTVEYKIKSLASLKF